MTTLTVTATTTAKEVAVAVEQKLGVVDGRINGTYLWFGVDEMRAPGSGSSRWASRKSGIFLIKFRYLNGTKTKIFRTRKDGYVPLDEIKAYVDDGLKVAKAAADYTAARNNVKAQNKPIIERVKALANKNVYVSEYGGSAGTYVTPSEVEVGKVNVQVNFGAVNEVTATKIFELLNTIKG